MDEYKIREDFLCFIPVEDVTGKGLANTLLTTMEILLLYWHKPGQYERARYVLIFIRL